MNTARAKETVRRALRRLFVRLNAWGLGALLRRLGRSPDGAILMTHCVGSLEETRHLPADMKTAPERIDALLRALARRGVRCVSVRELVDALDRRGEARGLVAFSMDDGYVDNLTVALPVLQRHGAGATVYVETDVLGERRVSWLHRTFYLCFEKGERWFVERYVEETADPDLAGKLRAALETGSALGALYQVKRVLKYEADRAERERVTRRLLEEAGGDDETLARAYLTWDQVRQRDRAGVEIGAHTRRHEILSRLDEEEQAEEIEGSRRAIEREVGRAPETFAYPFGRPWDFDERTVGILHNSGFRAACAAIDGLNDGATDRMRLRRLPFNDDVGVDEILAEIDGTLPLARRLLRIRL